MQTQKNTESRGICREEFQEVLKYLILPAIMTHIRKRVAEQQTGLCGLEMGDIQAKLEMELGGANKLMLEEKFQSSIVKQLKKEHAVAERAKSAALEADKQLAEVLGVAQAVDSRPDLPQEVRAMAAALLKEAQADADAKNTAHRKAQSRVAALLSACKPSDLIYFISWDNCPSYSLLEGSSKDENVVPGLIPMLQVCVSPVSSI